MRDALIIFQKNPIAGKTKTRLAATIGNEKALRVYDELLNHVHGVCGSVNADKFLYFSDHTDSEDPRWNKGYRFFVQQGADLGLRMRNALNDRLQEGYSRVVLIGTDCYELTSEVIRDAFEALDNTDYVFGPAEDGGYYLVGARVVHNAVFLDKSWSHEQVLQEALDSVALSGASHALVATLPDVDREADLKTLRRLID